MKLVKSSKYVFWINIATFIAILVLSMIFYKVITKYLSWKMTELKPVLKKEGFGSSNNSKTTSNIGIVSMMKDPKNLETWLQKHRELGIRHFYIRLEETPDMVDFLKEQSDVTVVSGVSKGVNEYDEQQTRQNEWVNEVYKMVILDNSEIKWLIHIDSDEILQGDLNEIEDLPEEVRTFWMQNLEARFSKIPSKTDNCFVASKFIDCSKEPKKCVSYGNGKGGGRVAPDVSSFGPHRMKSTIKTAPPAPKLTKVFVQHYESCDFEIYKKKFKRLSVQDKKLDIPFAYYNESILASKNNDEEELRRIYTKYRVE